MWKLLLSGIGLGLIDCLNPFTIFTQAVLQPFVKKVHHVLYYIAGTYLSYLAGGLLVYWGIDQIITSLWRQLMDAHGAIIHSLELMLGVVLLIAGILLLMRRLKHPFVPKHTVKQLRSVHPTFLFAFGAVNTIGDLPSAFPYLIFIAQIVEAEITLPDVALLLAIYCFIYTMPLTVLYLLYLRPQNRLEQLLATVSRKLTTLIGWVTILSLAVAGVFFIVHGWMKR